MKKTMKKCFAVLLALAMLFAMAVPAAAEATTEHKQTVTFTEVAPGDTVKAYQVMEYGEDYNSYVYDEGFQYAMNQWNYSNQDFDQYFSALKVNAGELHTFIGNYVMGVQKGILKNNVSGVTYSLSPQCLRRKPQMTRAKQLWSWIPATICSLLPPLRQTARCTAPLPPMFRSRTER